MAEPRCPSLGDTERTVQAARPFKALYVVLGGARLCLAVADQRQERHSKRKAGGCRVSVAFPTA